MNSVKNIEILKKKVRYVLAYNGSGPGQIFDGRSYAGSIRFIVFSILVIYVGWHADDVGRWIFHQFGENLIVSPGQEAWHQMVALGMGIVGIVIGLINIYTQYTGRKRNAVLLLHSEESSAPSLTDVGKSTLPSTKQVQVEEKKSDLQK